MFKKSSKAKFASLWQVTLSQCKLLIYNINILLLIIKGFAEFYFVIFVNDSIIEITIRFVFSTLFNDGKSNKINEVVRNVGNKSPSFLKN